MTSMLAKCLRIPHAAAGAHLCRPAPHSVQVFVHAMLCPEPVSLGPVTGEHIGFRLDYARYVEHERLRHWLAEDIDALDRSAIVQVRDAGGRNRSRRSSRVEIGNRRAEARAARQHACEL